MKDFSNHIRELVKRRLGDDPRILVPRGAPVSTGVLNVEIG